MADLENQECPKLSYGWRYSTIWNVPFAGWPQTMALVKETFLKRAMVKVFSEEIDQILFLRSPELQKRSRKRYVLALGRVAEFLEQVGFSKGVQGELIELALALKELDAGTVREFLRPAKRPTNANQAGDKWLYRAYLSVAIDIYCQSGDSRRSASNKISVEIEKYASVFAPKSKNVAGTLANWHRQFINNDIIDDRASGLFENRDILIDMYKDKLKNDLGRNPNCSEIVTEILVFAAVCALQSLEKSEHEAFFDLMKRKKAR